MGEVPDGWPPSGPLPPDDAPRQRPAEAPAPGHVPVGRPPVGRPSIGRLQYDARAAERGRTAPVSTHGSGATAPQAQYAVIAAVASWVICPVIGAIIALRLVAAATREIAAAEGELDGARMVAVARVTAIVNIVVWLTFLSVWLGPKLVGLVH